MFRHRLVKAFALSLLVACARDGENVDSSESAVLPNGTIFELGHDGTTYRRIAEAFAARGVDLHVDLESFAPAWPLADAKSALLNRHGTPMLYSSFGYHHMGVDVMRSDSTVGSDVLAPHDGVLLVFDWAGNRLSEVTNPYATVVAIYDSASHVITLLQHVAAAAALVQAPDGVEVTKGSVIGKLAFAPLPVTADASRLANTQVVFVDGEKNKLLNPVALLPSYKDNVLPEVRGLYLSDASGEVSSELASGKIDLVVEVVDRDDDSGRNFEVSAVAFTVKDQNGTVLVDAAKCELDSIYDSIASGATFRSRDLVDFGSAVTAGQISGGWPNSDVDNPFRSFRYALTNLQSANGRCTLRDDASAFLEVKDDVTKLDVSVTVWDAKGNQSTRSLELARPPAPPAEPAEAGPDGGVPEFDLDGGF